MAGVSGRTLDFAPGQRIVIRPRTEVFGPSRQLVPGPNGAPTCIWLEIHGLFVRFETDGKRNYIVLLEETAAGETEMRYAIDDCAGIGVGRTVQSARSIPDIRIASH